MTPAEADGVLFDGTTHCAEELPLAWSAAAAVLPAEAWERNAAALRLLTQLEEHRPEHDDTVAPSTDLARLESKMDLLLQLAGTLVALQRPPPPGATLRLSSRGLVWHAPTVPLTEDQCGRVLLHLHPAVPYPLEVSVRVLAIDDTVAPVRAWLAFEGLAEPLAALLERFTFRHHRRAVAGRRLARAAEA